MSKKKKQSKTIEELLEEALVPEEEQPYKVPENWVWTKLGSVVQIQTGKKDANHGSEQGMYPFYTCASEPIRSETYSFNGESILLPGNGANVGLALYYDGKFEAYQRTYVLNNFNGYTKYLYYHLLFGWKKFNEDKQYGSATNYIKLANITEYIFPLSPLVEQKRIADKIEHLFAKIDEAERLIEEVKESYDLQKESFAQKAFTGDLTNEWRRKNADIRSGTVNLETKKKNKFKDQLDSSILDQLHSLPDSWKWVRLNDLIKSTSYGTSAKADEDEAGRPVLRMGNIVDGKIHLTNLKYLPENHPDVPKCKLEEYDLLFNRTNSYELVGKTAVVTKVIVESSPIYASYLIRVDLHDKELLAPYVCQYINSNLGRRILLTMVTQQVGQANINSQKLASLPIPLPPSNELNEINKLSKSYMDTLEKEQKLLALSKNIDSLKQSILQKAFRGELGTNDSSEESALEQLKQTLTNQLA